MSEEANTKWPMANRMVTWSTTSRDPESSRSLPPICSGPSISKTAGDAI